MFLNDMPKYRRWSNDAIFCYKRGCVCKNCPIAKLISEKCRMKAAVLELVRNLGVPNEY